MLCGCKKACPEFCKDGVENAFSVKTIGQYSEKGTDRQTDRHLQRKVIVFGHLAERRVWSHTHTRVCMYVYVCVYVCMYDMHLLVYTRSLVTKETDRQTDPNAYNILSTKFVY